MADRVRRDITRLAKRCGSKFVEAEPRPVGGCLVGEYDLVIQVHKVNRIVGPFGDPRDGASDGFEFCLLYTSPSPRDRQKSRMPSSA